MQRGNQQPIDAQFFCEENEVTLFQTLAQTVQKSQGTALTQKQQNRLAKTLEHYMKEVWDVNGPMPLTQLNREVVQISTKDFTSYLRREGVAPTLATSERIVSDPANQRLVSEPASQRLAIQQGVTIQPRPSFESNLLMDTGSRFEQLQQDRVPPAAARPTVPDFQISLTTSAEEPSALSLFETAKKAREVEAARTTATVGTAESDANPLVRFMSPPSVQNDPVNNPTTAQSQPIVSFVPRAPLQQDFLIKQDDVISYRDTEYNLFIFSADRDWYNNTTENRYSFSVNFNVGNNVQGFTYSPSATKKFKNISRIELVKAIVPTEGIQNLVVQTSNGNNTSTRMNILTYPYIVLRIPELDGNNYGTDDNLDNSFGVLQYDANWISDAANLTDGFLAMIPKFMKCQKVYQPTPLATLTKLTIQLQTPYGTPISSVPDVLNVQNIYLGNILPNGLSGTLKTSYSNADYLYVQTSTYFSQWAFTEGNLIQFQGLNASQVPGGSTQAGVDFVTYLQQSPGVQYSKTAIGTPYSQTQSALQLVGINYTGNTSGSLNDVANSVGYANLMIFRTPHVDPTTGSTAVQYFGGSQSAMNALGGNLSTITTTSTIFTGAKLINLTHQTNVVLRIITRELDPAARVRPDNL